ncbi:hypothetical protein L1987_04934 [Smallanthus sonchifolius]|uniref:Uncharacterized protein n=1 Tax=Smallanthus sonchifolius TaxID=185202 RepID=A0ACB9JTY5_9ASTR|nr:hypothetical protein L1987_04934 [Smallanthus sonchifolius]
MSPTLQHNEHTICSKEKAADMKQEKLQEEDDEDDLFEIDLEAVGELPPPYYWESCLTVTANTLFANCLVPITDVSSAVPMANPKDANQTWLGPFQSFAGVSSPALSSLLQKTLNVSSSFDHGK